MSLISGRARNVSGGPRRGLGTWGLQQAHAIEHRRVSADMVQPSARSFRLASRRMRVCCIQLSFTRNAER